MTSTEIDSKFLLYYLVSPKAKYELRAQSAGSVVSHLNMKNIRAFEIEAPSLDEQKAIASTLSALDDKIDLLHRQNATLEGMGEVLFREWFLEGENEDWEEGTLADVADNIRQNCAVKDFTSDMKYIALEHIDKHDIALKRFGDCC